MGSSPRLQHSRKHSGAMGHKVTILAGQVAEGTSDESVYDMQEGTHSRSIARRVIDPIWYRIAPRSAINTAARHRLLRMIGRACTERGLDIIEMEESFGWAALDRQRDVDTSLCATARSMVSQRLDPWSSTGQGVPRASSPGG